MSHETIPVGLDTRAYDVLVGDDLLAGAGALIAAHLRRRRAVIVTDSNVAPLYLEALQTVLARAGIASDSAIVPAGEASKSFAELERLAEALLGLGVERRDTILAFGGGVVGDLAGFAAAILRRGVGHIQIPTTLLAQVDSSVGGKTAIDSRHGKNLIGAFHQPRLVLADTRLLATLARREMLAGYAEIAKYGLLGDADFFHWLETHGKAVVEGEATPLHRAVAASIRHKARIVAADEREQGMRELLNLGHTFGHALEAETGFGSALLHGEAVAIGCVLAFELSAMLGLCPGADAARVRRHFAAVGLPTAPAAVPGAAFTVEALWRHMQQDKKVRDGRVTLILARGIGQAFAAHDVEPAHVQALLERELA